MTEVLRTRFENTSNVASTAGADSRSLRALTKDFDAAAKAMGRYESAQGRFGRTPFSGPLGLPGTGRGGGGPGNPRTTNELRKQQQLGAAMARDIERQIRGQEKLGAAMARDTERQIRSRQRLEDAQQRYAGRIESPGGGAYGGVGTVGGAFICYGSGAVSTIDNTGGTLWSAGAFTGGNRAVNPGDTLTVSYSVSM